MDVVLYKILSHATTQISEDFAGVYIYAIMNICTVGFNFIVSRCIHVRWLHICIVLSWLYIASMHISICIVRSIWHAWYIFIDDSCICTARCL